MENFVHLHVHSNFSLCHGAARISDLLARSGELGMDALALTDHNGLYGAVRFYKQALELGIKPIIGAEVTVRGGGHDGSSGPDGFSSRHHLVLLAKSRAGYSNLCKIISHMHLEHPADPFAEWEVLERYAGELIALSGCKQGEVAALVAGGHSEEAAAAAERHKALWGEDFFIELQNHLLPQGASLTERLAELARAADLRTVATNNVHYLREEDYRLHDVLTCIDKNAAINRKNVERENSEYYFKTPAQMKALFSAHPEAVATTREIAARCNLDLELGKFHFPSFPVPAGKTALSYLKEICLKGAREKYKSAAIALHPCFRMPKLIAASEVVAAEAESEALAYEMSEQRVAVGQNVFVGHSVSVRSAYPASPLHNVPGQKGPASEPSIPEVPIRKDASIRQLGRVTDEDDSADPDENFLTPAGQARLEHELKIIGDLGMEEYFLVVHDIVGFAREQGIRFSGRGSAAGSLVVYLLGVSAVDPLKYDLLFERFLNPNRREMPDVDIDFDSRRRDEVIEYIFKKFGAEHTAMVATVSTFRSRSAVRETGKALGKSLEEINYVTRSLPYFGSGDLLKTIETLPELRGKRLGDPDFQAWFELAQSIHRFPRHMGVHLAGVIISSEPITDLMPLQWSAKGVVISQFDKDDIETLGLIKMDILGLRMLSAIEFAVKTVQEEHGTDLRLSELSLEDPEVYKYLRTTKTVGLFQVESPGMRELLGRLQPTEFNDLIANISLFRPGPVKADMITPYIARRHGKSPPDYLHPRLENALKESYGVIVFHEQVIRVVSALTGLSPGEADLWRRSMTMDETSPKMQELKKSYFEKCREHGVDEASALRIFNKLKSFASFGFCKAHAAAFALISYQSAYLRVYFPAEFFCGILNNQPMGSYPNRVILNEARRVGVKILPLDINLSDEEYLVESGGAIRVGLKELFDISRPALDAILTERANGPFASLDDFCRRVRVERVIIQNLIEAGAFDFTGQPRRELLWELKDKPAPPLPPPTGKEVARSELSLLGLNMSGHPLALYTKRLRLLKVAKASDLEELPSGMMVRVAGLLVIRHTPPTRSGKRVIFITLEDETGLTDITIFPDIQEEAAPIVYGSAALLVEGELNKRGKKSIAIIAKKVFDLKKLLD